MSLLIKALQKAEQSKSAANPAAEQSLDLHELELELAPHDPLPPPAPPAGLIERATPSDPVPPPGDRAARQTAAGVFRAKQQEAMASQGRLLWLVVGGLVLLLVAGAGFYAYLQSLGAPTTLLPLRPQPLAAPSVPAPITEPQAAAQPPLVDESQSAPPVETSASAQAPSPGQNASQTAGLAQRRAPETAASAPLAEAKPAVKPASEEAAVKVLRNRAAAAVNQSVAAGYQAYMAGEDSTAERLYRQAAQAEPRNVDALLGLAAVTARRGNPRQAEAYYTRVLELDPRNAAAQAGLLALAAQTDPQASESRLQAMLAQQPEAANLHAALGNLHADQGQWAEAQQAYFQAHRIDPDNPEYAFNLAVSLDQLGKSALALEYYQRAEALMSRQSVATLDQAQLTSRIAQLRQALGK